MHARLRFGNLRAGGRRFDFEAPSGDRGLRPQLVSGWYPDEDVGAVWSTQDAVMVLPKPASKSCITITGLLPPALNRARNTLWIACDGYALGLVCNYSNTPLSFQFRSRVPLSSAGPMHIGFRIENAYCPAESGRGPDHRQLGFALFHGSVRGVGMVGWLKAGVRDAWRQFRVNLQDYFFASLPEKIEKLGQKGFRLRRALSPRDYTSGLSIVIIDTRDGPGLEAALSSVSATVGKVKEPVEVLVISPGAVPATLELPPGVARRWISLKGRRNHAMALRMGTRAATHDWMYVIHGGRVLLDSTLTEALQWRAPGTFAVVSASAGTGSGWLGVHRNHGVLEFADRAQNQNAFTRGALCAKEDGVLFNRRLLCRICNGRDGYRSFFWRNLEWSVRAWKMGFETLFCPTSRIDGPDADSIADSVTSGEDRRRFLLRNTLLPPEDWQKGGAGKIFYGVLGDCDGPARVRGLLCHYATRWRESGYPCRDYPLEYVDAAYHIRPHHGSSKPNLIFVSPYVLFPPSHGSAVVMAHLLSALRQHYTVHILSDELTSYGSESLRFFSDFASVRLVSGRREDPDKLYQRIPRIESHSHSGIKETLRLMLAVYRPRFVEIEHVELSKLIDIRKNSRPHWILNLLDVLLSESGTSPEDQYELDLINRFDALICCSREDADLLGRSDVTIVPNSVDLSARSYRPSPDVPRILFVGPARSAQNIPGIQEFLDRVYALLLDDFPNLEMWIVSGRDTLSSLSTSPSFCQRGVQLFGYVESIPALLEQCALTINPISGNRGSCLKVVESLAAGRVCVSTREGARGFLDFGFPSLLAYDSIDDFTQPLRKLLGDAGYRRSLERLDEQKRSVLGWEHAQQKYLSIYTGLEKKLRQQ